MVCQICKNLVATFVDVFHASTARHTALGSTIEPSRTGICLFTFSDRNPAWRTRFARQVNPTCVHACSKTHIVKSLQRVCDHLPHQGDHLFSLFLAATPTALDDWPLLAPIAMVTHVMLKLRKQKHPWCERLSACDKVFVSIHFRQSVVQDIGSCYSLDSGARRAKK